MSHVLTLIWVGSLEVPFAVLEEWVKLPQHKTR